MRTVQWRYHQNGKGVAHAFPSDNLLAYCGRYQDNSPYWLLVSPKESVPCLACHRVIRAHLSFEGDLSF